MPYRSVLALTLTSCLALPAQDWPEFRGPNRSGTATGVKLPVEFNARTNVAWTADLPMGRSSPIVSGNQLFLTAANDNELLVLSYDTRSGKRVWTRTFPRGARRSEIDGLRNDPASPTPVTNGRALYAFFPDLGLVGLSAATGKLLWKLPLPTFVNNYGMASSPVLHDDTLYLQCDQTHGSFVIAVDARTGRVRWRKERDKNVLEGWSTPLILAKSRELLAVGSSGLEAIDIATGQTRWSVPTGGGLMIPAPIIANAITAGVGNGSIENNAQAVIATFRGSDQPVYPSWEQMISEDADKNGMLSPPEITKRFHVNNFGIADPDRDGFITQQEWNAFRNRGVGDFGITSIGLKDKKVQWRYARGLPYVPSPILYGNVLYWVRTGGILTAIDAGTGKLLKEGRSPEAVGDYFASPIAAEGKLYLANAEGKISVVRAGGADWEFLRVNDLEEPIAATPAIADNALFVRTHSKLYCFRAQ